MRGPASQGLAVSPPVVAVVEAVRHTVRLWEANWFYRAAGRRRWLRCS